MSRPARVVAVEHLGDFRLRLTFSDGLVRELDFDGVLEGEVFEPLQDRALFAQVRSTPSPARSPWPSGVDLDPERAPRGPRAGERPGPGRAQEYHLGLTG